MQGTSRVSRLMTIIIGLTVLLVFASCSQKEEIFVPAPFAANENLTGTPLQFPELNLEFAPPAAWYMLDSLQLDGFRKMLGGTDLSREFYPIFPLAVFADSISGCMMYLGQIEESEVDLPQVAQRYHDFMTPRIGSSALTTANYTINNLKVYYYLLHSTDVVNYKVIGETAGDKRFMVEFIIGGVVYAQLEPAVSASLASLKTIPIGVQNQ